MTVNVIITLHLRRIELRAIFQIKVIEENKSVIWLG